jgi:predicted dehydrogenase
VTISTKLRDPLGPQLVPRIAVIGLGYWGPNIVRVLHDHTFATVPVVCDATPAARAAIATRYPSLRVVASIDEVLEDETIDAVAIATPISSHFQLSEAALSAGKHVFVEKPLGASVEEAEQLIALARSRGLVLMPGHTFLYSPPVMKIKDLISAGEIGEIYFISTSRVNLGLHQADASVVWDLGPHDFSILIHWLGEAPAEVAATSRACILPETPDVAFINVKFPSGTIGHVELAWLAPSKLRRTAIVGSEKMIVYDDIDNEPVRVFDSGALLRDPESFGEYRLSYRVGDIISPRVDPTEPLLLELQDFVAAIQGGPQPRSSDELGIEVVRTLQAVDRSLAEGGIPVAVEQPERTDVLSGIRETTTPDR